MSDKLVRKYQELELNKHFESYGWESMTLHVDGENYIFTVTSTAYDIDDRPYGQESLTVLNREDLADLYKTLGEILSPNVDSTDVF